MLLSKDQILATDDIETEEVHVSQWGGSVRVRGLTGVDRDAFEAAMVEGKGRNSKVNLTNLRARLVSLCVVDEAGARVFTDADVQALGRKSAAALDTVFTVAQRLSGLQAKDVEELAGNSASAPSDDSSSDSLNSWE